MQSDYTDIFIWVTQGVIGLLIAAEAFLVNTEPELALRNRRAFQLAFAALLLGLFALIIWQGVRSVDARHQGEVERQKFEQERRDLQAAFDREIQDSQIDRNRLGGKIDNLGLSVKFVANTFRAQKLNGQKLTALVSHNNNSGQQIAVLNNQPPLQTISPASETPLAAPPIASHSAASYKTIPVFVPEPWSESKSPQTATEKAALSAGARLPQFSWARATALNDGRVLNNLYYFRSTTQSSAPDKDLVLKWEFGDGAPVVSRATEQVLHAFSYEEQFNPKNVHVTVVGTVPHGQ